MNMNGLSRPAVHGQILIEIIFIGGLQKKGNHLFAPAPLKWMAAAGDMIHSLTVITCIISVINNPI